MEYSWYDLVLLYMVYSFLGWVAETVVAAARGPGLCQAGLCRRPLLLCLRFCRRGHDHRPCGSALFSGIPVFGLRP